jgi:uncharacterized membrane protein
MFIEYYIEIKYLHIIAVILFAANTIITPWWRCKAIDSGNINSVRFVADYMSKSDTLFYSVAGSLVFITGLVQLHSIPALWEALWIQLGILYWILTYVIWVGVLRPIQKRQRKILRGVNSIDEIPEEYWKLNKTWRWAGWAGFIIPLFAIHAMVMKEGFYAY